MIKEKLEHPHDVIESLKSGVVLCKYAYNFYLILFYLI